MFFAKQLNHNDVEAGQDCGLHIESSESSQQTGKNAEVASSSNVNLTILMHAHVNGSCVPHPTPPEG